MENMASASLLQTVLKPQPGAGPNAQLAPKALAWARVSTDMQEERGASMPEQLRQIREYGVREGIEIVEEYSEAVSAFQAKAKRTEFDRMVKRAKEDPEIGIILVHDFSRFSRDSLKSRLLIRELREAGVEVFSLSDPSFDPDSVAGVYLEAIVHAKNEAYSREVSFHTKKGCRANVQTRDPETGWCYKNGGQPLFGYKAERLERGGRRGKSIIKCIWVPDDTVVAGKPIHEWARECLSMAERGATLDEIRDFCNQMGIPAPRQKYWGQSTWYAILQPHILLKYAGYEVWNVHRKNGSHRPPDEWTVVPNAHEALISEDQALRIIQRREDARRTGGYFGAKHDRSLGSPYLLSGGLFKCARCGANMVGLRTAPRQFYYRCGSNSYRKGRGCGKGVYVPRAMVEQAVLEGVQELLESASDAEKITRMVNQELAKTAKDEIDRSKDLEKEIAGVEAKITNIRTALEDGLSDAAWANTRLAQLQADLKRLEGSRPKTRKPRLEVEDVTRYLKNLSNVLEVASARERKELLRLVVEKIELAPEQLTVEIVYRAPGPNVMDDVVAGALYHLIHNILGWRLRKRFSLPRQGRRPSRTPGRPESSSPPSRLPRFFPANRFLVTVAERVLAA